MCFPVRARSTAPGPRSYIDASELALCCSDLGHPLSESELEEALTLLDSDGSGQVEQAEFVRWWMHGSTEKKKGGGTGGKLNVIASAAKQSLLDARYMRQQAQSDAQLLRNRIQLLKHEEEKARRKIAQTESRAHEMVKLKKKTMRRLEDKAGQRATRRKEDEDLKHLVDERKAERERTRYKLANQVAERKKQDVESVRDARKRGKAEREAQMARELEAARLKHAKVKKAEGKPIKIRKAREKKLHEDVRLEYERKIADEEAKCREKERDVRRMEKEEAAMIERLRKVQAIQKDAFAELEAALTGGGGLGLTALSPQPPPA